MTYWFVTQLNVNLFFGGQSAADKLMGRGTLGNTLVRMRNVSGTRES